MKLIDYHPDNYGDLHIEIYKIYNCFKHERRDYAK